MSMRSWVRNLVARPVTRPIRKAQPRARLGVEGLEDRWVPSSFTVLNALDDGSVGSLRWAVVQANTTVGGDTIAFDPTVFSTPQTITLGGTQLELSDTTGATAITGPAGGVTVSGGGLSRVFRIDDLVTASISGLTITGGNVGYDYGGGVFNNGTLTLTNCTVSGNAGIIGGLSTGSYYNPGGSSTLTNCTVSGNSGFGDLFSYFGTTAITNNVVGSIFGTVSGSNNLIGAGGSGGLIDGVDGNIVGVADLGLAPLGNYGGTSLTMPLLPGSPALNAGTNGAGLPTTDQRGLSRFGATDIGAFESQGFNFTLVPGSTPQTSDIGTAFAPLAVNVTANNPTEPVDGAVVRFVAAPAVNGATAILADPAAVVTNGRAAVAAVPNNVLGSYTVVVDIPGFFASFDLTNAGRIYTSLVVNDTSDSLAPGAGLLSLREAVAFNNYSPTGNLPITFDSAPGRLFHTPQTITLTGRQLELSNPLGTATVTGPAGGVRVSGGGLSRVFRVDALVTASISGLTITGGRVDYANGGGLLNDGALTLTNCTVRGNSASGYGTSGGGVFNGGTATLINCTVSGNSSGGSSNGGGGGGVGNGDRFSAPNATLTMTNCTLSGNSAQYAGGGLYNGATATLTNCTVSGNSAAGSFATYGGGVATGSFGNGRATTTLNHCTVSGNRSDGDFGFGGGVSNSGTTTLTNCTVSGNSATASGGGAFSTATVFGGRRGGTLTLTNCTVSGNTAVTGGGVFTQGGAIAFYSYGGWVVIGRDAYTNLNNCTVSGNSVTGDGGGLATSGFGTTTATNTTIRGNSAVNGGGASTDGFEFFGFFDGTTSLTNCTVSDNSATGNGGGLNNTALGSTTVTGSNIKNNTAVAGGGIASEGALEVAGSTINNNRATSKGGGINATGGSVTITGSAINSNRVDSTGTALGGGISCEDSVLSLTGCTVNANRANGATAQGGGIYARDSTVDVRKSNVNGNQANGTVLGEGGGIYRFHGVLTLVGSTVKGNTATTAFDDVFDGP